MHVNKFCNYLLALVLGLQTFGYLLLYTLSIKYGLIGLSLGGILYFVTCYYSLDKIKKVNVYNDDGEREDFKRNNIFTYFFVLFGIIGILIAFILASKYGNAQLSIPVIVQGILYPMLYL